MQGLQGQGKTPPPRIGDLRIAQLPTDYREAAGKALCRTETESPELVPLREKAVYTRPNPEVCWFPFPSLEPERIAMANSLSITSDLDKPKIFECPNCHQTIDTASSQCRFCSAIIDRGAAEAAAAKMARINRACSDASYLKIAALCAPGFLLIFFIPFMSLLGEVGLLFLAAATPVWIVLWCFRYLGIETDDPDYRRARKTVMGMAVGWAVLVIMRLMV